MKSRSVQLLRETQLDTPHFDPQQQIIAEAERAVETFDPARAEKFQQLLHDYKQLYEQQRFLESQSNRTVSQLKQEQIKSRALHDTIRDQKEKLHGLVEEQQRQLDRLKRFFSSGIAARILEEEGDNKLLNIHRSLITVVFCDLRGWTDFTMRTEPEDVMRVLEEYHAAIGPLVFQYRGTLEQFTGDGLLVFFNDPVPLDQAPLQAVRMAIEMREKTSMLIAKWEKRDHDLGFGVGIDQGYASCGTIGFEGRYDYTAIGAVVNRAARLCGKAAHGQILVSQKVLGEVENDIEFEPMDKIELKGLGPTRAFNIIDLQPASEAAAKG